MPSYKRGNSSVGRARPCQGRGREFESRFPLQVKKADFLSRLFAFRVFLWLVYCRASTSLVFSGVIRTLPLSAFDKHNRRVQS
jgi:hypothetical protein